MSRTPLRAGGRTVPSSLVRESCSPLTGSATAEAVKGLAPRAGGRTPWQSLPPGQGRGLVQSAGGFLVSWRYAQRPDGPRHGALEALSMNTTLPEAGSDNFIVLTLVDLALQTFDVFLSLIMALFTNFLTGFFTLFVPH